MAKTKPIHQSGNWLEFLGKVALLLIGVCKLVITLAMPCGKPEHIAHM